MAPPWRCRTSDLLPALKGGGSLWAGRRPRPTLTSPSGGGHGGGPGQHRGPFAAGLQRHERGPRGVYNRPRNNGIRLPHNFLLRETFAVRLKNPKALLSSGNNPRFSANGSATYPLRSVTSPEAGEGPGGVPRRRERFEQLCRYVVTTYLYRQTGREARGALRQVRGARANDQGRLRGLLRSVEVWCSASEAQLVGGVE